MKTKKIKNILEEQRSYFDSGITKNLKFRIEQLNKLQSAIKKYEEEIYFALMKDLHKPAFEVYITEIGIVLDELRHLLKNIKKWTRRKRVPTPIPHIPSRSYIYSEPYGVVLIYTPWNYPFQLLISPLIGAIASGNCAVLKTAPAAKNISKVIKKMITSIYPEEYVAVFEGDTPVSQELLKEKYDYIFYTGGEVAGKIVMKAAAKNLTPVTLELGGKSPCIVDKDINIKVAAQRIVWGKFINAGQTCVAPDYLLVNSEIKAKLITEIGNEIKKFFGENPEKSNNYCRIINNTHFTRLKNLLIDVDIIIGGNTNSKTRFISPTIIDNVSPGNRIMKEEIFGPILPVIEYTSIEEAIKIVKDKPKPLALYIFSSNKKLQDKIINDISYGGGCINDTLLHLANPNLPFGGVGSSGIGAYHGKASFDTFSHKKSILKKSLLLDTLIRYAPYKKFLLKIVKLFLR